MILEINKESLDIGMSIAVERQRLWGLDKLASGADQALTSGFSTYYALMRSFQDLSHADKESLHLFALYAGAVKGGEKIRGGKASTRAGIRSDAKIPKDLMTFGSRRISDYHMALDSLIQFLGKEMSGKREEERERYAAERLNAVEKTAEKMAGQEKRAGKRPMSELSDLVVRLDNKIFTGFSYKDIREETEGGERQGTNQKSGKKSRKKWKSREGYIEGPDNYREGTDKDRERTVKDRQRSVNPGILRKPFIVGNTEAIRLVERYCKIMGLYDPKKGKNPFFHGREETRPLSILLEGRPGCGKSLLIRYAQATLAQICRRKGMKYKPILVDNSFKERWHGSDVQNLKRYFSEVNDRNCLSSLSIDDAESIFPRRDSDAGFVEKGNINALLQFMNGINSGYAGNYLVIATTNCPDQLDPAVRERFNEKQVMLGPERPEHYTALLKKGIGEELAKDVGEAAGRYCFRNRFSGRNVDNVVKWAVEYVQNTEAIQEEMMEMDYYANLKMLSSMKRRLGKERLFQRLEKEKKTMEQGSYL